MSKDVFKKHLTNLMELFNYDLSEKQLKIYWKYLQKFSDESFIEVCDTIIKNETRFPAIAVFYKYLNEMLSNPF